MKLFRSHIIYHLHGKGINEYISKSIIKKSLYKWAFKNSSVICLSEALTYDIAEVYKKTPYVVNNAIPYIQHFVLIKKTKDKNIRILFMSNLIVSKGIYIFLDALDIMNKNNLSKNVEVIIIGQEVEISKQELLSQICIRNLQNVIQYVGPKYDFEKEDILANTDILVYPTLNDVWGLVILEAMQFGIPVIASREGAIPEIVDDSITGYLVGKNRSDQIAEKLEILVKNPQLRIKMGEAGRKKFLEKYTLDIFESNIRNVFEDVISKI